MNIHEYQAKELLKKYGIATPKGQLATTPDEAVQAVKALGSFPVVLKAQVHAGGRGKAGGVKLAKSLEEVKALASEMIGMKIVTRQTGPKGKVVRKLLVEEGLEIQKELYLASLVDRQKERVVIMASTEGGMEIEEVAKESPEKIFQVHADPAYGLLGFEAKDLALKLGLGKELLSYGIKTILGLYRVMVDLDCQMAEINPLILTKDGRVLALDAKVVFEDNGLYRHPELQGLLDEFEEDPRELLAREQGINYISVEGNIGCLVNGAGLAMSTMDIIKLFGGDPANFLDVGGGANKDQIREAFRLILKDERVKGILVNIFGGILRCDELAKGITEAAKEIELSVPLVVRLEGTNAQEGRKILKSSGLKVLPASDMEDAARKIVEAVKAA
jgi:succinyl-CoA synthetase beta subunit